MAKAPILTVRRQLLQKSQGGPFIGPRGGKWADAARTIPWKEGAERAPKKVEAPTEHRAAGADAARAHYTEQADAPKPMKARKLDIASGTYHVTAEKGDQVKVSNYPEASAHGQWIPKASLRHFEDDLSGRVTGVPKSGNAKVDAVIDGKAKFLGKGDDGVAFQVGDSVVKASTTVPFQPLNPGHRTPERAIEMLRKQSELGNKLADAGVKGIQRSEFVVSGDKGFQVKSWVEIPEKLDRKQLDAAQQILQSMHKAGYCLNDQVQVGLDKAGDVVMFDIGKAAPDKGGDGIFANKRSDLDRLAQLYQEHGEDFVNTSESMGDKVHRQAKEIVDRLSLKDEGDPKFARFWIKRARTTREKEAKAQLEGDKLAAAMKKITADADELELFVQWAIEDNEKKMEKSLAPILLLVERLPDNGYLEVLVKGAGHKYLMRVPTGKPKPKWKYYYKLPDQTGGKISEEHHVKKGARFKGEHGFHEVAGEVGNKIMVRHWSKEHKDGAEALSAEDRKDRSKKGRTFKAKLITREEFAKIVNEQHADRRGGRLKGKRDEIKRAMAVLTEGKGGAKQDKRVMRLVDAAHKKGWITEKERDLYAARVEKRTAFQAGEGAKLDDEGRKTVKGALDSVPAAQREALMRYIESVGAPKAAEKAPEAAQEKPKAEKPALAPKAKPKPAEKQQGGKKDGGLGLRGDDEIMFVGSETGEPEKQKVRYRLVELDDLKASHNPMKGWGKHKEYPEGVQERTYHNSKSAQLKIERQAKKIEPRMLINDNPDANQGPPIIQPDGVVLGGNSRTMTMQLAYGKFEDSATTYRDELAKKAKSYGFSSDDVAGMKQPVLVREVDKPKDKAAQADLVRKYNEAFTREMDPRAEQVAKAKRIGKKTLTALTDTLGVDSKGQPKDEQFSAYLHSGRSKALVRALQAEGVLDMRNVDKYVEKKGNREGRLTEDGRTLVSRLLMGHVVDDPDTLDAMGQANRDKIAGQLPYVLKAAESNKAYDLKRGIKAAADVIAQVNRSEDIDNPMMLLKQGGLEGDHPAFKDKLARTLLAAMWRKGARKFGPALREFAAKAEKDADTGSMSMFGNMGPSSEEKADTALREAFGYGDDPLQEEADAAAKEAADKDQQKQNKGSKKLAAEMAKRGIKKQGEEAA